MITRAKFPLKISKISLNSGRGLSRSAIISESKGDTNQISVDEFFKKIGRNTLEHASKFEDMNQLLKAKGPELKEMGIDTRSRKYILRWIHFYR